MKKIIILSVLTLALPATAWSANYVSGHYNKNGTYVEPHYRSSPDKNYYNNYGSQGNSNPYSGKAGTQSYDQYQNQRQQRALRGYGR